MTKDIRLHTASAHLDTFCHDHLPPRALWPELDLAGAGLAYPAQLNAAAELLDRHIAAGHGERVLFHYCGETWSYRRLYETSNRIAHVLVEDLLLIPGNRVLLRSPNNPMMAACWFGVLKAGGVAVSTMPLLRQRELATIVEKAKVSLALTDHRIAAEIEEVMLPQPGMRVVRFGKESPMSLETLMESKPAEFANCATSAEDVAIIAFTSGTTGRNKGTMHFHRDLLAVADTFGRHVLAAEPDDIFIGSPPLAFTYSLGGLLLFPTRIGASTLLVEQVAPPQLLEAITAHKPTVLFTSPTAYRAMLPRIKEADVSSLRKCVSAGEHLPKATFDAWLEATGLRIIDGIGSTEMLHMFISSPDAATRSGSTGRVVPGYRARVVDEHLQDVPPGQVGRLAVIGPTGCRYLNNLEDQRKYVQNGWNLTGDAYIVDDEGYFWYQARTDDMIISSGYNISGPEVENALLDHPNVLECAVIGVPDETRGHLVKAYVVLEPGSQSSDALVKELQDFVKTVIAPYKYPRAIEFVPSLPRTLTGKLQRYVLRQGAVATQRPDFEFLQPDGWANPIGYANGIAARGRVISIAGQIGWNPETCHFESDDFAAQAAQTLKNVDAVLKSSGAEPHHLVRMTWYVTDKAAYLAARKPIGRAYRELFGRHYPAMSVVVVSALIEDRARIEIEATAVVPE
ncbi:MAG: benzoate-CoA ligase family protein [Acidobacteriales bacterium]|nr:benzoate-CoA ligase family protein [Terriglobales bacterium]